MKICNASVFLDNHFVHKDIFTDGEHLADISGDETVIDGEGCYLIPGLTDIHFHGCVNRDFCDGTIESLEAMALYQASYGITTMVPATMTIGKEQLAGICSMARNYQSEKGAIFCGINMEGPFIAESRKGAQNADYIIKPDCHFFRELNEMSGGMIKLLAIAPEVDGATDCIRELKNEVVLSVAHTDADCVTASKAFSSGIHHVTHLYNAMEGMSHRSPGVVGAAADQSSVEVELICDGIHIDPVTVRQTFKMFGDERIIMISDSMEATGMPDGIYQLAGQTVYKKGNRALLEDGKTIAGSVMNLMDCLRIAVKKMGIPLESAVKCAAVNPAKSVGIFDRYGSIQTGKIANLVLLKKEDLSVKKVFLKGREFCYY